MKKKRTIIAVGDICLDIKTDPLSGFTLGDRQFRVNNIELSVGGNSANFALGASNLGLPTRLIACCGKDAIGRWLRRTMKMNRVRCIFKTPREQCRKNTALTSAITYGLAHEDGTRQMISYNGPNLLLGADMIDKSIIRKAGHVHRSGYWWSPKMQGEPTARMMKFAQSNGAETSLDIGTDPDGWTSQHTESIYKVLEYTDIFFANETELRCTTGKNDVRKAAEDILCTGVKIVAIHRGPNGTDVVTKIERVHAEAFSIKPLNPIGSGDIYNAGFVYGRMMNWGIEMTAKFANACAAYYLERTKNPYPSASAVISRFMVE